MSQSLDHGGEIELSSRPDWLTMKVGLFGLGGQTSGGKERLADQGFAGLVRATAELASQTQDGLAELSLGAVELGLDPCDPTRSSVLEPVHEQPRSFPYPADRQRPEKQRQPDQRQNVHVSPPGDRLGGTHGVGVNDVLVSGFAQWCDLNQVLLEG